LIHDTAPVGLACLSADCRYKPQVQAMEPTTASVIGKSGAPNEHS
jgi:hypothetical protein